MKFFSEGEKVIIKNVENFDLKQIFECGQCFRWKKEQDNSYTGVAFGKVINIREIGHNIEIKNTNNQDFKNIWYRYFDLDRDYNKIKECISKDDIMKKAIEFGSGIRLLNQDIQELLISFIISANNRIPRISKSIDFLSEKFGRKIYVKDKIYYSFPSIEKLACVSLEEMSECKIGFRGKYIKESARIEMKKEYLKMIKNKDTDNARELLMKFSGVGPKIADCVLLFSGTKRDVFPTDVWIKRIMEELYFKREASLKEIQEFVKDYFGEYAGFAQQYLFYYAREKRIGAK